MLSQMLSHTLLVPGLQASPLHVVKEAQGVRACVPTQRGARSNGWTPATPTQLIIRRHLWTMPNAYVFPNETRAAFGAARHDGDRDKKF